MNIAPATEKSSAKATHPQGGHPGAAEASPTRLPGFINCSKDPFLLSISKRFFIFIGFTVLTAAPPASAQTKFTARLERLQQNPAQHCKRPLIDLKTLNIRGERGFTRGLGRSMLPAMKVGALALIWRLPSGFKLRRGMVLYFRGDYGNLWIKRLIGLPGDRIVYRQSQTGLVFTINGHPVRRSAKPVHVKLNWLRRDGRGRPLTGADGTPRRRTEAYRRYTETLPNGTSYRILHQPDGPPADIERRMTVPRGRLFVMGDNRYRSRDSRHPGYGLIKVRFVFGLALCDVTDQELMEN